MKTVITLVFILGFSILNASTKEEVVDFTLKSVQSSAAFKLSEARGKFVALHFLLKTECPICLRHTHTYLSRSNELPDAIQIFIKPDEKEDILNWTKRIPAQTTSELIIYQDPGAKLAKTLKIPDGYKFHGQTVHYPALVLIDPEGKEIFRYVGKNNGDRYSFDDLIKKINEFRPGKD